MENRIIKIHLLKAMRQIRNEYKKEIHSLDRDTCALCKLYLNNEHYRYDCSVCPMNVFWADSDCSFFPCMNRKCAPVECDDNDYLLPEELSAVTEFYNRAIDAVSSKTTKELNAPLQPFTFLREIDKQVAKEYGLNVEALQFKDEEF